jgi:hypothetical protein
MSVLVYTQNMIETKRLMRQPVYLQCIITAQVTS